MDLAKKKIPYAISYYGYSMLAFIINLKNKQKQYEKAKSRINTLGVEYEFIQACDGTLLTTIELNDILFNHPRPVLTRGEIGCAYSHYQIYKRIVDDNLPFALILEDDFLVPDECVEEFKEIIKIYESQKLFSNIDVLLLQTGLECKKNSPYTTLLNKYSIGKFEKGWNTHAYIISNEGAKKLCKFLFPIRYVADCWEVLKDLKILEIYSIYPGLVIQDDIYKYNSSIEGERKCIMNLKIRELIENEIFCNDAKNLLENKKEIFKLVAKRNRRLSIKHRLQYWFSRFI